MPLIYYINTRPKKPKLKRKYRKRQRTIRMKYALRKLLLLVFCFMVLAAGVHIFRNSDVAAAEGLYKIVASVSDDYRSVLEMGLPRLKPRQDGSTVVSGMIVETIENAAQVKVGDPRSFLSAQLPLLKGVEQTDRGIVQVAETNPIDLERDFTSLNIEPEDVPASAPENTEAGDFDGNKPLVAIYNTHNAETYLPSDGVERVEGQNGGVVDVAAILAGTLEEDYNIRTALSTQIHDYPSYERSYGNSLKTARALLKANPSVQMIFDIHRDAGVPKAEGVEINGKKAAKVMFVVGNLVRWEGQPQGEGNLKFAQMLENNSDELFPGLIKGIRVKDGRYNQHLHPHALLIEIGNSRNSLEEAEYSARLLAEVINDVLTDIRAASTL